MKKILVASVIVCLCLSACSSVNTESSSVESSTNVSSSRENLSSSSSAVEQSSSSSTEGLLTLEEIKAIFSELDTKKNEMVKWVLNDYSKIPIDSVPIRKVDNVVVEWIGTENTFVSVPGTAVFAKVTEDTLPGFPWKNTKEIEADILKIYISISKSGGLEYMISMDFNNLEGLFYQFDDDLYFRVNHKKACRYIYWDYSTVKLFTNKLDEVSVIMREIDSKLSVGRTLVKNLSGNWVLGDEFYNFTS